MGWTGGLKINYETLEFGINIKSSEMLSTKQLASVRGYSHEFIESAVYGTVTAWQRNMRE